LSISYTAITIKKQGPKLQIGLVSTQKES